MRLKILKKLRTASLNSTFTGSYKKSVHALCKSCDVQGRRQENFQGGANEKKTEK